MATPGTNMMRALTIERDNKVHLRTVPLPKAGSGEVLIRVMSSSINPVDWKAGGWLEPGRVGGFDYAGEIVEGPDAGTRLFGFKDLNTKQGTWAEYAAVCVASSGKLGKIQDSGGESGGPSWGQLGALGIAGLSAWGLVERASLQQGEWAVVQRAHSGVGHLVAQLAARRGVKVIAVVDSDKQLRFCRGELKLDHVLKRGDDIEAKVKELTGGKGASVLFNVQHIEAGVDSLLQRLLSGDGRIVCLTSNDCTSGEHKVIGFNVGETTRKWQAESATELAKLMQSKQITLFVSQELTQEPNLVAEALQAMRGHEQQVSKGAASTAESDVGASKLKYGHCGKTAIIMVA